MLQTKQNIAPLNLNGIKLDYEKLQTSKYTKDEIQKAYSNYSISPIVNKLLRKLSLMPSEANKQVACIKQAINESKPISGKFYRGLTCCKDEATVRKFIFNNKGFTSVAPEENKRYAEIFFAQNSGAFVEFDLRTPIKGFKASNFETIFAPDTFTPSKYDLINIGDRHYKIVEK